MPGSVRENDQFVKEFVQYNNISTVLDVGAGQGTYSHLLRPLGVLIDAIEVWPQYIAEYDLASLYDEVYEEDVREVDFEDKAFYDLVVFGDVLEHMSEKEALDVWHRVSRRATYGLISVPIIHYPQGPVGGNPYEVHVQDHLTPESIRAKFGPFIKEAVYPITGTFIKEF